MPMLNNQNDREKQAIYIDVFIGSVKTKAIFNAVISYKHKILNTKGFYHKIQ